MAALAASQSNRPPALMRSLAASGLFLLLPLVVPHARGAALKGPEWRVVQVWGQSQGLPQNSVMALRQTRDGYLWIGTKGGVARFDGLRFTTFDDRDRLRLRDNEAWALGEGQDGSVWIGTYGGGLSRYKDGRFEVHTRANGLCSDFVVDLSTDRQGALWIATDGGLSRLEGGRFTTYSTGQGRAENALRSVYCDADGTVWVGTVNGLLLRFHDNHFERESVADLKESAEVKAILRDSRSALWLATTEGVYRKRQGRWTRFTTAQGLPSNWDLGLHEDPRGILWVAAHDGLAYFEPQREVFRTIPSSATAMRTVKVVTSDREGNLWLGGLIDGLARVRQGVFAGYDVSDGLADEYVTTVFEDSHGDILLGTAQGLSVLHGGALATYKITDPAASNRITALAEDHQGRLWVGTNEGLYRFRRDAECGGRPCRPALVPIKNPALAPMNTRVIHVDRAGALWLGIGFGGVVRYQDGRFTAFTTRDGLASDAVRGIVESRDGSLWIGTKGGLNHWQNGRFTTYTTRDGLAHDSIEALYVDRDDVLWIGTRQGVNRLAGGRFMTFTVNEGLYASYVYCFVEDDLGNLWMNSSRGVFRVRKQELNDLAAGKRATITSVAYGLEHGLSTTVGVISQHPVALKARDGRIWFCTLRGVAFVDPRQTLERGPAPPVRVEEIGVDGRIYDPLRPVSAPPGRGDLFLRYTALSFTAPESLRFAYQLAGFNREWIDAGTRRVAYYTNLPPGGYTFRVRACSGEGVCDPHDTSLAIYLAPHFYQTWWFRTLGGLWLALAVVGIHQWRVRALRRRKHQLAARVKEALAQIKVLRGLLPICASCKKIRDDSGYWNQIETYIHDRSEAEFSHGICPECLRRLYPEYLEDPNDKKE